MGWLDNLNPFSDDFDPLRAGTAVATGGLSEVGGARTVVEGATGVDPLQGAPEVITGNVPVVNEVVGGIGDAIGGIGDIPGLIGDAFKTPSSDFQAQGLAPDAGIKGFAAGIGAQQVPVRSTQAAQVDPTAAMAAAAQSQQARGLQAATAGGLNDLGNGFESGAQRQAIGLAQQAALGQGPSAAQAQLRAGNDAAMRSQLALANSARGGAGAQIAAQRQAAQNVGQLQQQSANQAAQLRAQEQQQALGQLAGFAGQARGQRAAELGQVGSLANQARAQDLQLGQQGIDLATTQAGLTQEANLANLGAAQQADQLTADRQLGALQGLLGFENLAQDAFLDPQRINAQIEAARLGGEFQRQGQLIGGIAGGLGTLGAALV